MKILVNKSFILLYVLLISVSVFAQGNSQAIKFDEFNQPSYTRSSPLTERSNRFARQIVKEPQTNKAVIIYYKPRKSLYGLEGKEWGEYAQGVLKNGYKIIPERIILIDGGVRETESLEFWIVPEGTELPKPNPHFDESEAISCPEIRVAGDGFQLEKDKPLKFSVNVKGGEVTGEQDFQWKISDGKIISGQGTNRIEIDLSEADVKRITASVQVKGYAPECNNHAYSTTKVGAFPYKLDDFEYNYSYMIANLDYLMIHLQNEPTFSGYVIIYGQRVGHSADVSRTIRATRDYFRLRRYDSSRVTIIDGGFREEGRVEIYLIPPGVEPPKPTPTVDKKFVVFTDKKKRKSTKRRQ